MAEAEKIRVLVVDDDSETRENIRKLLQFETDIEVVGAARSGKEAIELVAETDPDVVLMDINMPDMDGIKATEIILRQTPYVQVVILSVQNDQNYMRRAMLVGARDFLPKPPMADELTSTIRRAGQLAHDEKAKVVIASQVSNSSHTLSNINHVQGKVIMVFSPKGGVGCTTVAVNLALALHNEETESALVDANLQFGDVAIFLNEHGKNSILDLTPIVDELDQEIVRNVMIRNATTGLHILSAPSKPEFAEKIKSEQISKLLEFLKSMYAYIIVDTSSYVNDITLAVLDVCDVIVLLTTQDIPSIKNNRLFLDLMLTLDVPKEKIVFSLNKFDKRITISPEKIGENLKLQVAAVVPLDERVVIPSVNRGVPFVIDNKNQPAAKGIFSLAEAIRLKFMEHENSNN
ncbi:MAG: response regulator [Chloroflexota bacterium]